MSEITAIRKCITFLSDIDLGGHNDELHALIEKLNSLVIRGGNFQEKVAIELDSRGSILDVYTEMDGNVEVVTFNSTIDEDDCDEMFSDGDSPRDLARTGKPIW